jgi:hypothetical protein
LHILQNKSVGNGRYLIQKYCQIPTTRITDGGVALDAVPNLMVEYINKGFLEGSTKPCTMMYLLASRRLVP